MTTKGQTYDGKVSPVVGLCAASPSRLSSLLLCHCRAEYCKSAGLQRLCCLRPCCPAACSSLPSAHSQGCAQIADIWSCGVMLYVMLVGAYPFERPEDKHDQQKLQNMIKVRLCKPEILIDANILRAGCVGHARDLSCAVPRACMQRELSLRLQCVMRLNAPVGLTWQSDLQAPSFCWSCEALPCCLLHPHSSFGSALRRSALPGH